MNEENKIDNLDELAEMHEIRAGFWATFVDATQQMALKVERVKRRNEHLVKALKLRQEIKTQKT